jgi:hypothetical protein
VSTHVFNITHELNSSKNVGTHVLTFTHEHLSVSCSGRQRCSPHSGYCASHPGKTESRSPTISSSDATESSASPDLRPWPQPRPRAQQGAPPRPTPGLGLSLGLGRSHNLARPQPRPQEKSPPRPTWASNRLRYRGYIITLLLASCLRL